MAFSFTTIIDDTRLQEPPFADQFEGSPGYGQVSSIEPVIERFLDNSDTTIERWLDNSDTSITRSLDNYDTQITRVYTP
jgi:hypothetical protein